MSVPDSCPRCGARLAADAPGGLCPACLLGAAIAPAERPPTLDAGWRLNHYEVIGRLGEGAMGEVYRAVDGRLRREVAIKVLPSGLAGNEDLRRRFEGEAQAVAALNHPNIVTVYSVEEAIPQEPEEPGPQGAERGEEVGAEAEQARRGHDAPAGPVYFLTMELVEGDDLSELVGEVGLSIDRFFELAVPLAGAVGAAHTRGIIHRDLKPTNVMVTGSGGLEAEGSLKVLDFGLAKLLPTVPDGERNAAATEPGLVMGTAAYMSPEQAQGKAVDERTDVFSLGIMLYEMLTGSRPFRGGSELAVRMAIVGQEPAPPSALRPDIPSTLDRIVLRCLQKEPERRYRSGAELLRALKACREATASDAAGGIAIVDRGQRRRLGVAAYAIGIVALLALVAGSRWVLGGYWASGDRVAEAPPAAPRYASIAVLPLANISGDPEQEWFADGMTETLITELSRIRTLKVISRTSAMQYKRTEKPLRQIAEELGVDAVVEGSALWLGDRVRISAQLIDAATDHHLWADDYDGDLSDALALHREVAREIAGQVQATLSPAERHHLQEAPTADPQATLAYLRGLDYLNSLDMSAAEEQARRAIELDPGFARGHDLLATVLHTTWDFGLRPFAETVPEARVAAQRALDLEPSLASSRALIGFSLMVVDHDWVAAGEHLRAAYELDPSTGWAYGFWLQARGRFDEAIEAALQTVDRDPANPLALCDLSRVYLMARRHDEGLRALKGALEIDATYGVAHFILPEALLTAGRPEEAFAAFLEYLRMTERDAMVQDVDRYEQAYREGGWPAVWRILLGRIDDYGQTPRQAIRWRLRAHIGLGQKADGLRQLELLEALGDPWLMILRGPLYDPLRGEPRFKQLLQRLGYPEEMWR